MFDFIVPLLLGIYLVIGLIRGVRANLQMPTDYCLASRAMIMLWWLLVGPTYHALLRAGMFFVGPLCRWLERPIRWAVHQPRTGAPSAMLATSGWLALIAIASIAVVIGGVGVVLFGWAWGLILLLIELVMVARLSRSGSEATVCAPGLWLVLIVGFVLGLLIRILT